RTRSSRRVSRSPSSSRARAAPSPRPARSGSRSRPPRPRSSTASAPATPSAAPSATACSPGGPSGARSPRPAPPARSSRPGSSAPPPCPPRRRCSRSSTTAPTPTRSRGGPLLSVEEIRQVRLHEPERVARALAERPRGTRPEPGTKLMVIAADHPARGALAVGEDAMAMGDRRELPRRCAAARARPGVHGFLGTADLVEDLTLMGALDGKLVYGSMNRGGLRGAGFEMDDRFTGYTSRAIVEAGLDGGKMLLRLDLADPGSLRTMEATAQAVDELAAAGRTAMVEPFLSRRDGGRATNVLTTEAVVTSVAIA